jgi:hypothetical protein
MIDSQRLGRREAALLLLACLLGLTTAAGCGRADSGSGVAGTVTLVNRVKARVRGITCGSCPAALEAALRQRLDAAAISIVPGQAVDLVFERGATAFPSASFRQAIADGGGEVKSVDIEACGSIDASAGQSWLTSGSSRLLLDGPAPFASGAEVCVTGELRDQATPPRLVLGTFGS